MQTDARLPSHIWVAALVRRAQIEGAMAVVYQRGDEDRGDVMVKVDRLDGTGSLFRPGMGMDGNRIFQDLTQQGVENDISALDDYVRRACERDSDLWVVEIEDREGRHFITDSVETPQNDIEEAAENLFKSKLW